MVGNLKQAATAARKHVQELHPKRWITAVGDGYWTGEAWHVEVKVGAITDIHHFVLHVYPSGEIKQITHDTT